MTIYCSELQLRTGKHSEYPTSEWVDCHAHILEGHTVIKNDVLDKQMILDISHDITGT